MVDSAEPQHHIAEFHALSLLLQHRKLLADLDRLEAAIATSEDQRESEEWRRSLAVMLDQFADRLATHFVSEERSTQDVFGDDPDPRRLTELRALEREHPQLLREFRAVLMQAREGIGNRDALVNDLRRAIASFRHHEAREDALFADD